MPSTSTVRVVIMPMKRLPHERTTKARLEILKNQDSRYSSGMHAMLREGDDGSGRAGFLISQTALSSSS